MKKICFFVRGYPTKDDPYFAFIRPVVCAIADRGYKCTVICPQSITSAFHNHVKLRKKHWVDSTENKNVIDIFQPKYISVSNYKYKGKSLSLMLEEKAFKRGYRIVKKDNFDMIYGHFWDVGMVAADVTGGQCPLVIVTGEDVINVNQQFESDKVARLLPRVKGVISVSTANLMESQEEGLLKLNPKTVVLPNSIDEKNFRKLDKAECRKKLGLDRGAKIAIFVGDYVERKGILRVVEAAKGVSDLQIIAIGKGPQEPESKQIVFKGTVPHNKLFLYLNAADFFVLPTLAEGCCNAIVEALACGLPVISSDLPFNRDVLDEKNSILIDPQNIGEIGKAIQKLASDEKLRKELAFGALETAKQLTIDIRGQKIVDFLENIESCWNNNR